MKTYYKVVNGHSLTSARAITPVSYAVGEWTNAPIDTRLFVFDSLKEAKKFYTSGEFIYECEVKGGIRGRGCDYCDDQVKFWELFNQHIKNNKKIDWRKIKDELPLTFTQGILVKSVKLKKLVANK